MIYYHVINTDFAAPQIWQFVDTLVLSTPVLFNLKSEEEGGRRGEGRGEETINIPKKYFLPVAASLMISQKNISETIPSRKR